MGKLFAHLRSNVYGLLAVFIALSGTAYAAVELEKNEVKSKHIGKGQVKNADLANDAVTSPKVANGSLLGEDFAAGQLPQGPQGPQGPPGERGLQGERGAAGATNVVRRVSGLVNVATSNYNTATARCQTGERATGGGYMLETGIYGDFHPFDSYPADSGGSETLVVTPDRWTVSVRNHGAESMSFRAYAVCASP